MNKLIATSAVGVLLAVTAACGSDDTGSDAPQDVTLTVFAAASLTDSFTEIGRNFEAENPGVSVRFSFDGSSNLVAQIRQGAPADVFASANPENMTKATDDDLTDAEPVTFATNTLQIVTPPDNPAGVESLADLADADTKVVLCAPEVPCGDATTQVEENAGIDISPVSEEQSVTDVLNKVITGEADAGLVYVTDVTGAGADVRGITFPESDSVVNDYPIAPLTNSENPDVAQAFTDFVVASESQAILQSAGFGAP
ncbi:molybdate ABC transporter substrate-binding protein [Aeromicrobium sp. CF3.5]|uniref:molybdate ABC transporter substrate-binding protein n=1 Tax=Aeromicrobium sp. CF3.5 TaxID=3373078 RepID=UPI003EE53191